MEVKFRQLRTIQWQMAEEEAEALWKWTYRVRHGCFQHSVHTVQEIMERCMELLEDEDEWVRYKAACALRDIAASPHADVGVAFAAALPRVVEALVTYLRDEDWETKSHAAKAVDAISGSPHADIGAAFASLLPHEVEGLATDIRNEEAAARRYAAWAVSAMYGSPAGW